MTFGEPTARSVLRLLIRLVIALLFITGGVLHFINTDLYLKIMPPYIPWHLAMVYISGVAEIAGGLGLLVPMLRKPAAWGLVALLIAVFPANVYMAMDHIQVTARPIPQALLWARLPLQAVMIWLVLYCAGTGARKR
jgi:uncharacterized membrane protein